jgi:hypothetical protein
MEFMRMFGRLMRVRLFITTLRFNFIQPCVMIAGSFYDPSIR